MELTRARKLGIIYTMIFSILHITCFLVLPFQMDSGQDGREFREMFWEYIDYIIPFVLLFSWVFGRKFGEQFFINGKSRYWSCYRVIFRVTSMPHWFVLGYFLLTEEFREISFHSVLGSAVMSGMIIAALNMFPTLITAEFMRVVVKKVKK